MYSATFLAALLGGPALAAPLVPVPDTIPECSGEKQPSRQYLSSMRNTVRVFASADGIADPAPQPAGPLADDPILWPRGEVIYQINETSLWDTYNLTANPGNKDIYDNMVKAGKTVEQMVDGWKKTVIDAHKVLRTMSPCLTIRERNADDVAAKRHYISIGQYQKGACWSFVGYFKDAKETHPVYQTPLVDEHGATYQPMNLFFHTAQSTNPAYEWNSCGVTSNVHEHLHALGVYHEQSRPDRDNFVEIVWEAIQSGKKNNFDKQNITVFDSKLDWNSIMMYGSGAFANLTVGPFTILTKDGRRNFTQNRSIVGQGDVDFLNQLYRCNLKYPHTRPILAMFDYTFTKPGLNTKYYKIETLDLSEKVMDVITWSSVKDRKPDELCARKCYKETPKCNSFSVAKPKMGNTNFAWCFLSAKRVNLNNAENELSPYPGWNSTVYNLKLA